MTSRKGLKIQKWDSAHTALWSGAGGSGSPIDVYTSSASPQRGIQSGYFPALVADGSGGAAVTWYDNGAARNAWLKHVSSAGVQRFAQDGLAVSTTTSATEFRLSAAAGYDAAADEYVVGYERSNPAQSLFGLGAQRVQADGTLLWGAAGAGLTASVAGFHKSFINVRGPQAAAFCTRVHGRKWSGCSSTRRVSTIPLRWIPQRWVSAPPVAQGTARVTKVVGSDSLVPWNDDAPRRMFAQNILIGGRLGRCHARPTRWRSRRHAERSGDPAIALRFELIRCDGDLNGTDGWPEPSSALFACGTAGPY